MKLQETIAQLQARAQTDTDFRRELQANPEAVLRRETGMSAAELQQQAEQLSDDDLGRVAGGADTLRCGRCSKRYEHPLVAIFHGLICGMNPF